MAARTNEVIELRLGIVLEKPPAGVDFGLQLGKGKDYETIQKQRSKGEDLHFDCALTVANNRQDGLPNFLGPITQGPPSERFIYIDIGKCAGQADCCWERRIKVPLNGLTWELIEKASADPKAILEARLPGTAKDGGPACATIRPLQGWKLVRQRG